MQVYSIMSGRGYNSSQTLISRDIKAPVQINQEYKQVNNKKFSLSLLQQLSGVNFTGKNHESRTVAGVEYFAYKNMSEPMKRLMRKKCNEFNKKVDASELKNANKKYLPLMDDRSMKQFVDVCKVYCNLRNEPILCLGRSPKWFLNTALWMKGGIDDYKFVAFSKYWYRHDPDEGMVRINSMAPTKEEIKSYKRYLKSIQADPKHIVDVHKKTGKKVIITDYIDTGKGACSFLDLMSQIAEQEGVLEEFAKSIRIVGIGSMEYIESRHYDDEEVSEPSVPLPERLWPYKKEIKQEFHNMPLAVFEQMLINENTNECRATYYPHDAWTVYQPNRYKTGIITDKKLGELRKKCPRSASNFTPAMRDYRNLLNFRILDYLNENGLLREELNSKQWD